MCIKETKVLFMNFNLIYAFLIVILAHTLTYFQSQGQFFWSWAKEHPFLLSFLGIPISLLFIQYTKLAAIAFDGETWPGRVMGFAVGAIIFAMLSNTFLGESVNTKTFVCLLLALAILLIQIFWK